MYTYYVWVRKLKFSVNGTVISKQLIKEARSVTMNIFQKKCFLFKSFVKKELSYVFTINMSSTAESCMEK